jgi:hypothetical protein
MMISYRQVSPDILVADGRIDPAAEAAEAEHRFAALRAWLSTVIEAERRADIAVRLEAAVTRWR